MRHTRKTIRFAAVEALPQLAQRGDAHAIERAAELLEDVSPSVRKAAISAFARVAFEDDELAIVASAARLEHRQAEVRLAGLEAISLLAQKGNSRAIAAAHTVVADREVGVRQQALKVLRALAPDSLQTGSRGGTDSLAHSLAAAARKVGSQLGGACIGRGGRKVYFDGKCTPKTQRLRGRCITAASPAVAAPSPSTVHKDAIVSPSCAVESWEVDTDTDAWTVDDSEDEEGKMA